MAKAGLAALSRRERQIMDILYECGRATSAEVHARLADAPSYSTVRAILRILEEKGQAKHQQDGPRYVFLPATPREVAKRSALKHLLRTFFEDSTEGAFAALLDVSSAKLERKDFDRLAEMIDKARKEGK
jgi:BlaI family penicillinase repressor